MINMPCKTLTLTEWVLGNKGHPPKKSTASDLKVHLKNSI